MVECDDAVARDTSPTEPLLQLAASGYERAQRDRIRYGEQLRAILQGRDARWEPSVDARRRPRMWTPCCARSASRAAGRCRCSAGSTARPGSRSARWARRCRRSSAGIRRGPGCEACAAWGACSRRGSFATGSGARALARVVLGLLRARHRGRRGARVRAVRRAGVRVAGHARRRAHSPPDGRGRCTGMLRPRGVAEDVRVRRDVRGAASARRTTWKRRRSAI